MLETFFAVEEGLWAAQAVREATQLPLLLSSSSIRAPVTTGLSPLDVVRATDSLGLAAVGANCGRSLDDTARLVAEFGEADAPMPLWISRTPRSADQSDVAGAVSRRCSPGD